MLIYHGSDVIVENPEIISSNRFLDFGYGFYTTSNKDQAVNWCRRVCYRNNKNTGYVSIYEFDLKEAEENLSIKRFSIIADQNWLDFVVECRKGATHDYDIVIGPVADDNVYQTIRNLETGIYDFEYALKKLKSQNLKDQVLFHTVDSLKYIKFIDEIEVNLNE